ncbi:MAG TPA: hypothetical protein VJ793_14010 [Anaerolineae bacterium]|nr:hypothetical protein [Anaerolineae bacterium]
MKHLMTDPKMKRTLVGILLFAALILAAVGGVAAATHDGHIVGDGIVDTPLEMDQLQAQQEGRAVEELLTPNE